MKLIPDFWREARLYLIVALALLALFGFYNLYIALLGAFILGALYLYGREQRHENQRELEAYIKKLAVQVGAAENYALEELPLAIAVIDQEGLVCWHNDRLLEWSEGRLHTGTRIDLLWPELLPNGWWGQAGEFTFMAGAHYYLVLHRPAEERMILYIQDMTEEEGRRLALKAALPAVAYVQIDNFDDVLQGLTESKRAELLAAVNKEIVDWVAGLKGFSKKYTRDIYLVMLGRGQLEKAMREKFDVLDRVRELHAGNRIPVTLSVGVATGEPSLAALGERAQIGLDVALGRGGDQVAAYCDGKVQFFGGKSKAVEKNTRVKARTVAQAVRKSMLDASKVLVMGHVGEDFDSLGAAIGVARMARHLKEEVHVIVSQPGTASRKLEELLSDYSEYEGLLVPADQAQSLVEPGVLLVVVDTHRPGLVAAPEILSLIERTIVIDHHRRSEDFILNPFLVYLEPSASSTSEMVAELLMYFDESVELTRSDATALYAGIVVDTKSFTVQAGVRTFEAASFLRRAGADPVLVRYLFRTDFATTQAKARMMVDTEMLPGGAAVSVCPPDVRDAQVVASQVADGLLMVEGVHMSFVLFPYEDGVGISARCQGDCNVHVIMERFGGGGHQTVAGAQIRGVTAADIKMQLEEILREIAKESAADEGNSDARS